MSLKDIIAGLFGGSGSRPDEYQPRSIRNPHVGVAGETKRQGGATFKGEEKDSLNRTAVPQEASAEKKEEAVADEALKASQKQKDDIKAMWLQNQRGAGAVEDQRHAAELARKILERRQLEEKGDGKS